MAKGNRRVRSIGELLAYLNNDYPVRGKYKPSMKKRGGSKAYLKPKRKIKR